MSQNGSNSSSESFIFYRNLHRNYPVAARSDGIYIHDTNGKRYLDASGGAVVVSIGHGVKEIGEAALAQMEQITFSHSSQFTNAAQEELGRRMAALSPGGNYRLVPLTSGSEAIEAAIKISRQYHVNRGHESKHIFIARQQSYHGSTLGALSATGFISRRRKYLPILLPFDLIPPCNCYRCPFEKTYPECDVFCAHELERAIERAGPENVAAFIGEPIVGTAAGATVPPPEYFPVIRDICDRHDVHFIADEVMCGVGRTGKPFAIEHWGVLPDFIAAGKGMASGYAPLAGLLVSEPIYRAFEAGTGDLGHGNTFMGNPHSCAVGVAVLRYIEEHDLINRCARMGEYLFSALEPLRDHPLVGDIRGKGLFAGIDFIQDRITHKPYSRKLHVAERVTEEAFQNGLILYPGTGGATTRRGDHLLVAPPFIITEGEIDEAVSILEKTLNTVYASLEKDVNGG